MKHRKYKSVEPLYSRANKQGVVTGNLVLGENTKVMFVDRSQGERSFNGQKWNQFQFVIDFLDFGYSSVMKIKSTHQVNGKYVEYALDLLEESSLEEIYKTALLCAKINISEDSKRTEEQLIKYHKGEYSDPVNIGTVENYQHHVEAQKKILATLDIEQKDLKYFKEYENNK